MSVERKRKIYPTIFIGLGGTGNEVIRRVKQEMLRHGFDLPIVQYLVLDTVPPGDDSGVSPDKRLRNGEEYLYIGNYKPNEILRNMHNWPVIGQWWGNRMKGSQRTIDEGMGQMRSVRRIGFFYHFRRIEEQLERMVRQITAGNNREIALQQGYDVLQSGPIIYLVFSLCGGVGSSLFLDMAYVLRQLLKFSSSPSTLIAIAALPGPYLQAIQSLPQRERILSNTYAALQEIEHLNAMALGIAPRPSGDNIWDLSYATNFRATSVDLPFDYMYLIDNITAKGNRYNLDQVFESMSKGMFWLSGPSTAATVRERGKNLISNTLAAGARLDSEGRLRARRYSTFGISTAKLDWHVERARKELECIILDKLKLNEATTTPLELPQWLRSSELLVSQIANEPGINPIPESNELKVAGYFNDQSAIQTMLEALTIKYEAILSTLQNSPTWQRPKENYRDRTIAEIDSICRRALCELGPRAAFKEMRILHDRLVTLLAGVGEIEENISMRQKAISEEISLSLRQTNHSKSTFTMLLNLIINILNGLYLFKMSPTSDHLGRSASYTAHLRYLWYLANFRQQICQDIATSIIEQAKAYVEDITSKLNNIDSELQAWQKSNELSLRVDLGKAQSKLSNKVIYVHPRFSEHQQILNAISYERVNIEYLVHNLLKRIFQHWPNADDNAIDELKTAITSEVEYTIQHFVRPESLIDLLVAPDAQTQRIMFLEGADYLCGFKQDGHESLMAHVERIDLLGYNFYLDLSDWDWQNIHSLLSTLNTDEHPDIVKTDIDDEIVLLKTLHGFASSDIHDFSDMQNAYWSVTATKEGSFLHLDYNHQIEVYKWQTLTELIAAGDRTLTLKQLEDLVRTLTSSILGPKGTKISLVDDNPFFWTLLDTQHLFDNVRISQQLPLVVFTGSQFTEMEVILLRDLLKEKAPKSRMALALFLLEEHNSQEAVRLLKNNLQKIYAYDIIPMLYKDFLNVIVAEDPQKVFRQLMLSKVDLNLISPFVTTGPTPDLMFFGREHELREITEKVSKTNYALIGGRRIGKTSILNRLKQVSLSVSGFRAVYHDCSYTPTQTELVEAIALNRSWFPKPPTSKFTSFANVIQCLPNDKPLVILLDEADKIIPADRLGGYPLFNSLRALSNAGSCQFVFSGEQMLRDELHNPDSPLYNFSNELFIGPLDRPSINELVRRPMEQMGIKLDGEDKIVERIWNLTHGHPNVVQRLCARLINRINQVQTLQLTIEDVEFVIKDIDFLINDFLNTYWERATVLECLCTLIMAKESGTYTLRSIHNALADLNIDASLNEISGALERLVTLRNILLHTTDGYAFAVTAFPEILARTRQLDDLLALYSEKYRNEQEAGLHSKGGIQ